MILSENAVNFVRLLALLWIAALSPSVHRNIDILIELRLNFDMVSSASWPTPLPAAVSTSLVVEHQKAVTVPVRCVKTDDCGLALLKVVFYSHEKDALIDSLQCSSCFSSQSWCPQGTLIAIITRVAFFSPWVSNFDKPFAILQSNSTQYYIGVPRVQIALVLRMTCDYLCVKKHHFVEGVALDDVSPKSVHSNAGCAMQMDD